MNDTEGANKGSSGPRDLRRKAEKHMRDGMPKPAPAESEADARTLIHELQVHQIELEMQNEELLNARAAAEEASDRYFDLFEFAPVGYFQWDCHGRILQVNLTGAALLGMDRNLVVRKRFGQFVAMQSREAFSDFCRRAWLSDTRQFCEIKVLRSGRAFDALVEGMVAKGQPGQERLCRAAVIDVSQRKRSEALAAANQTLQAEIAARRKAEESLRASEERYREWFNSIDEGFCIIEVIFDRGGTPVDYRFLDVNAAFEKQTGLQSSAGKSMRELAPDHESYWFEIYGRIALTGEPARFMNEAKALNRWYDVYAYRVGAPASRQVAIIFNDITRYKQAELEIRSLAEFPQENPDPIIRASGEGPVLYANLGAVSLLETMGWEAGEPLPEELLQPVRQALRRGEKYDFDLLCRAGRTFSFAAAPSSHEGQVNLYAHEITERKRAEDALRLMNESLEQRVAERTAELQQSVRMVRAERRRFREVLDALPVYVILLTPDYQVPFANRFFEERFGKSDGQPCYEYLFHRSGPCESCESFKVLETKAPHNWEWTGPDGRIYDIHDFPFTDADGSPLIMEVGLDITQRRQDEQALAEQAGEVRRQADQLRALTVDLSVAERRERKRLANILHDHIQQILVAARMNVTWLKHETSARQMREAADQVDAILQEALEASRSLTVELSPPVLYESGLIAGLKWLAARMLEKHQVKVHLRCDHQAEPASEELRYLLFECGRELLFNAVKHAGIKEVHLALLQTNNCIKLIIRDEGKGFDADLLKRRSAGESTFGLFSIQQRLTHIGGEMEIATAPGLGTSITVTAPAGETEHPAKSAREKPKHVEKTVRLRVRERKGLHRVLVVDDHKIVREGLVGLMQFEPDIVVVGQAADGQQAIELAEHLQPDVVIMDVNLGEMSGVEATKRVLAKAPNTKVIGLSMHNDKNLAHAMRVAGATAYLTKGGPSEDLIAAIRAAR